MLSLSQRPVRLRLAQAAMPHPVLGQLVGDDKIVNVVVVDIQGKPVAGAQVTGVVQTGEARETTTDHHGVASLVFRNSWPVEVAVRYKEHLFLKSGKDLNQNLARGETVVVQIPLCITGAILKTVDMALLASAAALVGAGIYWKIRPLSMAGEVVFGATAFTIIYRLSCL